MNVTYPSVPKLDRVSIYWDGNTNYAYGRYNEYPVQDPALGATDTYRMEAVLSNFYVPYSYVDYTTNEDFPRLTLSYELVDIENDACDVPHTASGVKIIERTTAADATQTEWVLLLENDDNGRSFIYKNHDDAISTNGTGKTIKVRAVVSFNECVDGLYGTCTARQDQLYKFNKTHTATSTPDPTALVNGYLFDKEICDHPDSQGITHGANPPYGSAAPEEGRSVILEEFEVKFIDPVQFTAKTADPLYDKYVNKIDLSKLFVLHKYLYDGTLGGNSYVIYNEELKNTTVTGINTNPATYTFDSNGWNPILSDEFMVNKAFEYTVVGYQHIDDGTSVVLGNNQKVNINTAAGVTTLEWANAGENITRPFYILIEIAAQHKWGQPYGGTIYGNSKTVVKVPVYRWNDKP